MNTISKRKSNYTQVANSFLRDERLSFKAKGLFCYMFSMCNGWNFTIKSIADQQKDGYDSIQSALEELKRYGFIVYKKHSNGKGTYHLDDEPKTENPKLEKPIMGKSTRIKNNNLIKNNNINNNTKNSLLDAYIDYDSSITDNGILELKDFIEYRRVIKKPLKTIEPLKAYIKAIREILQEGYNLQEAKSLMREREWQTLRANWIRNSFKKENNEEREWR